MVAAAVQTPRVSSHVELDELVNSVHGLMRSVLHRLQPALEQEGITKEQFWSLHVVSSLQPTSLSTVARHLSVSAPTICANIDQLEEAGLVTRHRSDRDRRAVDLSLTPKGRKVESRVWGLIARLMSEAAEGLPPKDVATSIRVFQELQRRLEPTNAPTGGHP
jgi:MarR family transcriptional regulator, organic hydroperoxide resistance regulator